MSLRELDKLLMQIKDGDVSPSLVEHASRLLAEDTRLPDELRTGVLEDDPIEAASALLGVLGLDDGLSSMLRDAVRHESGDDALSSIDWDTIHERPVEAISESADASNRDPLEEALEVTAEMLAVVEREPLMIREAVCAEAGQVDVSVQVLQTLGTLGLAAPIAEAVEQEAGTVELAAGVMQTLRVAPFIPVAVAVRGEAGPVDVTGSVLETLGIETLPIRQAVVEEAGAIDVSKGVECFTSSMWVSALLDHELSSGAHRLAVELLQQDEQAGLRMTAWANQGREIRESCAREAGHLESLWPAIASDIGLDDPEHVDGWDGQSFVDAVRSEAGPIDIVDAVMTEVRRSSVLPVVPDVPAAANSKWIRRGLMAVAAATLAVLGATNLYPTGSGELTGEDPSGLQFAAANEIVVDDLSYDEEVFVQVIQDIDDEGEAALIIWVDDEAVL